MLKLTTWIACIGFTLLALQGCEAPFAQTEAEWESDCWSMHDTIQLDFQSLDTAAIYRLYFPIVFTEDYAFNNLYLQATVISPSGDRNLLPARFQLSDVDGKWYSEPQGDEIPMDLSIADGLKFNQQGTYKVLLYHYMRDEMLCGTRKVGIVLDEVEPIEVN